MALHKKRANIKNFTTSLPAKMCLVPKTLVPETNAQASKLSVTTAKKKREKQGTTAFRDQ